MRGLYLGQKLPSHVHEGSLRTVASLFVLSKALEMFDASKRQ